MNLAIILDLNNAHAPNRNKYVVTVHIGIGILEAKPRLEIVCSSQSGIENEETLRLLDKFCVQRFRCSKISA